MAIHKFWIFCSCLLTVAILTEPREIKQGYAGENITITAVVQESIFLPRLYHNYQLIAVLRGSDCDVSTNSPFYGRIKCSKDKDNNTTRIEIKNVTENDMGHYTVKTEGSLTQRCLLYNTGTYTNSSSALIIVTTPERFDGINSDKERNITYSRTRLSCSVVNQAPSREIKHGYVGENILITEFVHESIFVAHVHHNNQHIAVVRGSDCAVSTNSPFYGRIRCSKDKNSNKTRIEIKNFTENDTGLYTVETLGSLTQRCFLHITNIYRDSASELIIVTPPERFEGINSDRQSNITLSTTVQSSAVVNLAHSLTYTTSTNVPNIATAPESSNVINSDQPSNETLPTTVFSRSSVNPANSFTYTTSTNVLNIATAPESSNVINSDQPSNETLPTTVFSRSSVNPANSFTYTTSTNVLNIATAPESSNVINSDQPSNETLPTTVFSRSSVNPANSFTYTTSTNVLNIATAPESSNVINSDQPSNETLPTTVFSRSSVNPANSFTYTTSTNVLNIATAPESSNVINSDQPSNETLPTTVFSRSSVNPANSLSVPIYVIPVIIGAVGIMNLIICLLSGQRRKIHITKEEQHIPQHECDPDLYLTPISLEPPLSVPTCQERKTSHSNIAQIKTLDPSTRLIHMAQMIAIDGYEAVDISNNDDPEITSEVEEIIYESTENCNTHYSDTSGYLTVLGKMETTV